jgi:hypothetical protein
MTLRLEQLGLELGVELGVGGAGTVVRTDVVGEGTVGTVGLGAVDGFPVPHALSAEITEKASTTATAATRSPLITG